MGQSQSTEPLPVIGRPLNEAANAAFLNLLIGQLWQHFNTSVEIAVKEKLVPMLQTKLIAAKHGLFTLDVIDLGTRPLCVDGVHVYPQDEGATNVTMDLDVSYSGDAHASGTLIGLPYGVKDIKAKARVRVLLGPLGGRIPFAAVSFFLLNQPELDFDMTGLANVADLVGIRSVVDDVIGRVLAKHIVFPSRQAIVINRDAVSKADVEHPPPRGSLTVTVVGVRGVDDAGILGKPDIFVKVTVGYETRKTSVVEDVLHAEYDQSFDFALLEYEGMMVKFEVRDKDLIGSDSLGHARVNLSRLDNRDGEEMSLSLVNSKHGTIDVKFKWTPIAALAPKNPASTDPSQPAATGTGERVEAFTVIPDRHTAVIVVADLGILMGEGVGVEVGIAYFAEVQVGDVTDEGMPAMPSTADGNPGVTFSDRFKFVVEPSASASSLKLIVKIWKAELHKDKEAELFGTSEVDLSDVISESRTSANGTFSEGQDYAVTGQVGCSVHVELKAMALGT